MRFFFIKEKFKDKIEKLQNELENEKKSLFKQIELTAEFQV
jgi:hypothetical protein